MSKIRVITLLSRPSPFHVGVWTCVSVHGKDGRWMKMWGSKSQQILRCVFIYSFENPSASLSLFSVVGTAEERTSAAALYLFIGRRQNIFLLQAAKAQLAFFALSFAERVATFSANRWWFCLERALGPPLTGHKIRAAQFAAPLASR